MAGAALGVIAAQISWQAQYSVSLECKFLWQAQYTEPPGSAAERVGAAGPRVAECRFRGRRTTW